MTGTAKEAGLEEFLLDEAVRKETYPNLNLHDGNFFIAVPSSEPKRNHARLMAVDAIYHEGKLQGLFPVVMDGGPKISEMGELTALIRHVAQQDQNVSVGAGRRITDPKPDLASFNSGVSFHEAVDGKEGGFYKKMVPVIMGRMEGSDLHSHAPYTMQEIAENHRENSHSLWLSPSDKDQLTDQDGRGVSRHVYDLNFHSSVPLKIAGGSDTVLNGAFEFDPLDPVFQNRNPETAIRNTYVEMPDTEERAKITINSIRPNMGSQTLLQEKIADAPITDFPSISSQRAFDLVLNGPISEKTLDALLEKMKEYEKLPFPPSVVVRKDQQHILDRFAEQNPEKAGRLPSIRLHERNTVEPWNNPSQKKPDNEKTKEIDGPSF